MAAIYWHTSIFFQDNTEYDVLIKIQNKYKSMWIKPIYTLYLVNREIKKIMLLIQSLFS